MKVYIVQSEQHIEGVYATLDAAQADTVYFAPKGWSDAKEEGLPGAGGRKFWEPVQQLGGFVYSIVEWEVAT